MDYRVGIGYDIHPLKKGRKLFLGGIHLPYDKGLFGHSDADVLLHAIIDALLGAAGEKDIGEIFPDNDQRYKDISSIELLKGAKDRVIKKGFAVNNIDAVIIAKEPKVSLYKDKIKQNIAKLLDIDKDKVNIKAKTNQGIAELGEGKAIASLVVASLIRS